MTGKAGRQVRDADLCNEINAGSSNGCNTNAPMALRPSDASAMVTFRVYGSFQPARGWEPLREQRAI